MKIILTGATGTVGKAVLAACLKHLYIDHIYILTRTALPKNLGNHAKITEILHEDFESLPEITIRKLKEAGVTGCIWCLGGAVSRFKTADEATAANVSLPLIAAEAFVKDLVHKPSETGARPFRFVYMSCAGAEQDSFRSLWSQAQTRKMKGAAEKGLFEIADSEGAQGMFLVYSLRLGRVLVGGQSVANIVTEAVSVSVSDVCVARCAIRTVLDGTSDGGRIVENKDVLGEDWADINTQSL